MPIDAINTGSSEITHKTVRPTVPRVAVASKALLEDGSIDVETTARLVKAAAEATAAAAAATSVTARTATAVDPCSVTFHRAFDCCTTEPLTALESLVRYDLYALY